jgi:hypothetical protein
MSSRLLVSVAALATATCCPTLLLTVEQVKPAPRPWLPVPKVDPKNPIPEPTEIENRVLGKALPPVPDPYRDYADTDKLTAEQTRGALAALARIKLDLGVYEDTTSDKPLRLEGKVHCDDDPNPLAQCRHIELKAGRTTKEANALAQAAKVCGKTSKTNSKKTAGDAACFVPVVRVLHKGRADWQLAYCGDIGPNAEDATEHDPADGAPMPCPLFAITKKRLFLLDRVPGAADGDKVTVLFYKTFNDLPKSETLATFIHITDVQFRDPTVFAGGRALSHKLDWLFQSFEYDPELGFDDVPLVEALVATINEAVRANGKSKSTPSQPAFVIHTGDAIDTGVTSELANFHRVLDGLQVPWYDVLGSHDVMAFGNLMPTRDPKNDDACATVVSVAGGEAAAARQHTRLTRALLPGKLCIDARIRCRDCGTDRVHFVAAGNDDREPITHTGARRHFIRGLAHDDSQHAVQPKVPGSRIDERAEELRKRQLQRSTLGTGATPTTFAAPFCQQLDPYRPSWKHGFDLYPSDDPPGYYAFASELDVLSDEKSDEEKGTRASAPASDRVSVSGEHAGTGTSARKLVSIVLNQEDFVDRGKVEAGVRGRMSNAQMQWLREILRCTNRRDLVLVFGHVPLSEVDPAEDGQTPGALEQILRDHNDKLGNVIAYFYGHHHNHAICRDGRANVCDKFWEIETSSLLEFPQEARRVRIKYAGDGLAFLELVAFRERLLKEDERAAGIELARAAAQRDACTTTQDLPCTKDQRVIRSDGHDTNVRLWFRMP